MKLKHLAAPAAALALLAPAAAQAHVSLHPNTIPAGASATLEVHVPGEEQGSYVKKVDMQLPPGFVGVSYESVPGWSAKLIETKLATPIQTDDGPVDTEVSQIVWTWTGPLGRVGDGQFVDLPLSLAIPDDAAGKPLEFRTVQTYGNGQVVHWIDPSLEGEHPSPRINVTAKGGVIEDVAGAEAGPAPGQTGHTPAAAPGTNGAPPPQTASSGGDSASKGLGIVALALGALGLLAGLAALAASGRRTA
ncbi:MAG TPA: YcnI family protein [Solirubrobacteraceae bacterium]|nr:YcnI family protein [Solirubrobacteraceae bacterium]